MKEKFKHKVSVLFGKNIKRLRAEKGIRQEDLAKMVGIKTKSLSLLETGTGFAAARNIDKIAELLEVPVSELFAEIVD